ncbi:hypothetical protein ACS0TY_019283 [Phlomoides rotata]
MDGRPIYFFSRIPRRACSILASFFEGRKEKSLLFVYGNALYDFYGKKKNGIIFSQEQLSLEKLFDELKTRSWNWVVNKDLRAAGIEFKEWCLNPNKFLI